MAKRKRLDETMAERGLASDRTQAALLVRAGEVRVDGQLIVTPDWLVEPEVQISLAGRPRYVSRGGEKLAAALDGLAFQVSGRICADVGASTGGFTDCLLQHGAAHVFAIDVGQGILDWKLRQDGRVTVMEGVNARTLDNLPQPVELTVIDASFISLKTLLPVIQDWYGGHTPEVLALIKPQFEATRKQAGRGGGVIRSDSERRLILERLLDELISAGWQVHGLLRSPLSGPKGNQEFLVWLRHESAPGMDLQAALEALFGAAPPSAEGQ